jgi:antitoxin component YwqK of YwqJK toxin-antitoxin module
MFRFALFLFTLKILIGSNPNPVNESYRHAHYSDGLHTCKYSGGGPRSSFKIKNGNLDSVLTVWYENGQISQVYKFDNGRFIDTNRVYNPAGQLLVEELFDHDTIIYYHEILYYANGIVKQQRTLDFDSASRTICPFYRTVSTDSLIYYDANLSFSNMRCHGKYADYYESGKLKTEAEIVNYKYEGDYITYYENGNMSVKGFYHNNVYDGLFTFFKKNGAIKKTEKWSNGKFIRE